MRIVLLGDSITQGLGSKKINFLAELEKILPSEDCVYNMAMTGTVISYVEEIFSDIVNKHPDCAVILYGNVDAMLKPNRDGKIFRRLPRRFKRNNGAMLMPRPFYSHKLYKRIGQRGENLFRTVFRNLILAVDGTEQWMPLEQFKSCYESICVKLAAQNVTPVVCSTVYIDNRLFKGSDEQFRKYNTWLNEFANSCDYAYIDFYSVFKKLVGQNGWDAYYNADHFHPNGNGYLVMARKIADTIRNRGLGGNGT